MAENNCQKIKLLKLWELLRQETDEEHPMRTGAVCDRLVAMGISCDRRTLHKDMKLLNEQGYEVHKLMIDHECAYYVTDRSFTVPELKVLIDAVQAANFIPEKWTQDLIAKIADLGGSHRAEVLQSNIVKFNTSKHNNRYIFLHVEILEEAIRLDRKVIFRYFDLDENGQRVLRRDGHHYVVEPVSLIYNEDNYYLLCYSPKHEGTTTYRVDRMVDVELVEDTICEEARALRISVGDMTESAFKMFGGQTEKVTLEFDDKMIGAVYDKFGEDTKMQRTGEHTCTAEVTVQISPPFWGWLFQFGEAMKVIAPEAVIEIFCEKIEKEVSLLGSIR